MCTCTCQNGAQNWHATIIIVVLRFERGCLDFSFTGLVMTLLVFLLYIEGYMFRARFGAIWCYMLVTQGECV